MRIYHYNNHYGRIKGDKYKTFIYPREELDYHFYNLFNKNTGELFYAYLAKVGYKGLQDDSENIFFVDFEGKIYDMPFTDIIRSW